MAITATTLAANWSASDLTFAATAATGATVGGMVKVGSEYAVISAISGTQITVRSRGDHGTKAVAHLTGEAVAFGLQSDLPDPGPAQSSAQLKRDVVIYRAAGAITVPTRDTVAILAVGEASALQAYTLADPVEDGVMLTLVNGSAYASTVTLNTGFGVDANTDVFTFVNEIGMSFTLMSAGGLWRPITSWKLDESTAGAAVA